MIPKKYAKRISTGTGITCGRLIREQRINQLFKPSGFKKLGGLKFLYAAALLFSVVYIQSIGSGVGFNGSHLLLGSPAKLPSEAGSPDVINTGPNLSFELSLGGLIASSSCIISPSSELETAKKKLQLSLYNYKPLSSNNSQTFRELLNGFFQAEAEAEEKKCKNGINL